MKTSTKLKIAQFFVGVAFWTALYKSGLKEFSGPWWFIFLSVIAFGILCGETREAEIKEDQRGW